MISRNQFEQTIGFKGWIVLPSMVPMPLIESMRMDLHIAHKICRRYQSKAGIDEDTAGTVHHLPAIQECQSFLYYLHDNPAGDYIDQYFGGKYILNSFGGNFNFPGQNYASKIHRDIRTFQDQDQHLMLNTLVMLDDFTTENGATWMMPGTLWKEMPPKGEFTSMAEQALGPAGSILIFDSNVWHAAGENKTENPRRSVTPMYCRPWMKQGFDYPRAIGYNRSLPENLRQVLGYNARVPASLEEWYQPPANRMYHGDQG